MRLEIKRIKQATGSMKGLLVALTVLSRNRAAAFVSAGGFVGNAQRIGTGPYARLTGSSCACSRWPMSMTARERSGDPARVAAAFLLGASIFFAGDTAIADGSTKK